jgi:hypothetical protein
VSSNHSVMRTRITDFILTALVLLFFIFQNCGYEEKGHANTPPENPGSQMKPGVDSNAHPGNIDRDTITAHP